MADTKNTVKAGEFKFETDLEIPATTRASATSETAQKLGAMPVGASFLEPVNFPTDVKDPGEQHKVFVERAKTVQNRLSGAVRRFRKSAGNENRSFVMRRVNDATLGTGVRVWRTKDEKAG